MIYGITISCGGCHRVYGEEGCQEVCARLQAPGSHFSVMQYMFCERADLLQDHLSRKQLLFSPETCFCVLIQTYRIETI